MPSAPWPTPPMNWPHESRPCLHQAASNKAPAPTKRLIFLRASLGRLFGNALAAHPWLSFQCCSRGSACQPKLKLCTLAARTRTQRRSTSMRLKKAPKCALLPSNAMRRMRCRPVIQRSCICANRLKHCERIARSSMRQSPSGHFSRLGWEGRRRRTNHPDVPDNIDPINTPSFVASCNSGVSKASSPMNRLMVNPMPQSRATP